jgi:hypothetical protein
MNATRYDQGGSVLIIAVIAMLIFGILSFSFALLSRLEVTTGVNYQAQAQAEALAEAGLERGRDAVRTAADATAGCGFSRWTDPGGDCDEGLGKLLFNGISLGAGNYSVVIDNDCFPLVPVAIQDASCSEGTPGRDTNETAVLTAWATAPNGLGRARVRAIVAIDTAWKHVCSSSSQDNPPGYCNERANRNGNPLIFPADPNEQPGGPAAYDDLPRPELGCSAIDPLLHDPIPGNCPAGTNDDYPYTPGRRYVVQGTKGDCGKYRIGGVWVTYSGYFDCALTTPCEAPACAPLRKACVLDGDPRLSDSRYASAAGGCGSNTGMVFKNVNVSLDGDVGTLIPKEDGRNMYVMNGTFSIRDRTFHGTIVVEGDGGIGDDVQHTNGAKIFTVKDNSTHGRPVYGYPLAYVIYDPELRAPTAANPFEPQNTSADMGGASGTEIKGLVYSGGHVEFSSIVVVIGGVVAFDIQTRGSLSAYRYSDEYGKAAPPPGFSNDSGNSGNTVVLVRKSFVVCADYAADTGGGTACR